MFPGGPGSLKQILENSKHNSSFAIAMADFQMQTWLRAVRRLERTFCIIWKGSYLPETFSIKKEKRKKRVLGIHAFFLWQICNCTNHIPGISWMHQEPCRQGLSRAFWSWPHPHKETKGRGSFCGNGARIRPTANYSGIPRLKCTALNHPH